MAVTHRKTDDVLASARKDLKAQLAVVRAELGRFAAEERALTVALSSLNDGSNSAAAAGASDRTGGSKASSRGRSRRKAGAGRRRGPRAAIKSTADRVKELQGLLADGPKSRNDLAAALEVSPARVQQLLAELGRAVSYETAPGRQGKLWSLKDGGNGARPSRRKPAARKAAAVK